MFSAFSSATFCTLGNGYHLSSATAFTCDAQKAASNVEVKSNLFKVPSALNFGVNTYCLATACKGVQAVPVLDNPTSHLQAII